MPSNNNKKKPYFKKEFYVVIIIAIAILIFLFAIIRLSFGIKTQEIELKEDGGSYDGKVKLYRTADYTLVIETDGILYELVDGDFSLAGDLNPSQGINIGTASGAATGEGKFSANVTADTDGYPVIIGDRRLSIVGDRCYFTSTLGGDITWRFFSEMSSTRTGNARIIVYGDAAASWANFIQITHTGDSGHGVISTDVGNILLDPQSGQVVVDGDISSDASLFDTMQITPNTGTLPPASAANNGLFFYQQHTDLDNKSTLYFCVRNTDPESYSWVAVATGS